MTDKKRPAPSRAANPLARVLAGMARVAKQGAATRKGGSKTAGRTGASRPAAKPPSFAHLRQPDAPRTAAAPARASFAERSAAAVAKAEGRVSDRAPGGFAKRVADAKAAVAASSEPTKPRAGTFAARLAAAKAKFDLD